MRPPSKPPSTPPSPPSPPSPLRSPRRSLRRLLLCLLGALLALAPLDPARDAPAQAADEPPLSGLLVTLSATAEDVPPASSGTSGGGLIIAITLANRTGQDLAGVRVQASVPAQASVATASQPPARTGQESVSTAGGAPAWSGLALKNGERLAPLIYRVMPAPGADGAVLFRGASVQPEVTWTQPVAGKAPVAPLPLNGLWGDGGLRRTLLPSGLTIFTRERPDSATVSIRLAVRAGSRDEDNTTCGGSHWLEHAHFLGTRTRPDNQAIFAPIDAVGGAANASTGWEATDYYKLVPAENFDLALDVLSDQLLNSTFSPDAFNRERLVVHQEHQLRNDDPSVHSFDEFMNLVFQVSPLRRNPGSVVCLDALPLPAILAYRDQRYVTGNMAVAAIGNLRHDEAVAKIEQALASLRRGPQGARPRTPEPIETAPRREVIGDGSQSVDLRLGWPAPGDVDADSPAMFIVQDILGTTGRRLAEEIRDRTALASAVDADYLDFNDAGALMLSATTEPDLAGQVEAALVAQVRRLRDGDLTDDEVETSKRAIAGRRALADELNDAQTQRATIEVSGTLDSYDEYLARLRPVRAADVQRVAQKYLDPASYTLVVVRS